MILRNSQISDRLYNVHNKMLLGDKPTLPFGLPQSTALAGKGKVSVFLGSKFELWFLDKLFYKSAM